MGWLIQCICTAYIDNSSFSHSLYYALLVSHKALGMNIVQPLDAVDTHKKMYWSHLENDDNWQ